MGVFFDMAGSFDMQSSMSLRACDADGRLGGFGPRQWTKAENPTQRIGVLVKLHISKEEKNLRSTT
jgi:hypothetical protein